MLKKLSAVILATAMTISFGVNNFAYSNMYSTNSNIPDFSEVTNAQLLRKNYDSGATVYLYSVPLNGDPSWLYKYIKTLTDNGYEAYASDFFTEGRSNIGIGLYNASKGLYVNMFISEYGVTLIIGK